MDVLELERIFSTYATPDLQLAIDVALRLRNERRLAVCAAVDLAVWNSLEEADIFDLLAAALRAKGLPVTSSYAQLDLDNELACTNWTHMMMRRAIAHLDAEALLTAFKARHAVTRQGDNWLDVAPPTAAPWQRWLQTPASHRQ